MSCWDSWKHESEGRDAARWGYLDRESRDRYDEGRRGPYDSCERSFADGVDCELHRQEDQRQEEAAAERAAEQRREEARAYEAAMEDARYQEEAYLAAQPYPEPPPEEPPPAAPLDGGGP